MSAPQKQSKQPSRWGGFLQQAVASVESRLDNILAEDEAAGARGTAPSGSDVQSARTPVSPMRGTDSRPTSLSRNASGARTNDRLQERLAKAMARPNSPQSADSGPRLSTSTPRSTTPIGELDDGKRASLDSTSAIETAQAMDIGDTEHTDRESNNGEAIDQTLPQSKPDSSPAIVVMELPLEASAASSLPSSSARPSTELNAFEGSAHEMATTHEAQKAFANEMKETLAKLQAEHEEAEKKWQEELLEYTERMDALQSKLFYLTKEVSTSARAAAANAPTGSMEQKLLEKDEKIALLMEEGQKLSKTEFSHTTTIKKLRAQTTEGQKIQKDLRLQIGQIEKEKQRADERAKRAELMAKRAEEQAKSSSKHDRDHEALLRERNALAATISDMKAQLARALTRAETAENKAQTDALEREKRQVMELKDDISSQKIEHELKEQKLRRDLKELKETLDKEKELSKALEAELRGEQSAMERKLETLRTRAEVTSSSDSQAKLLRQIETLQSQYAAASENWRGIEGSLLTRLANLEKERDDVVSREEDLRRKARDANLKAKRLETDLEKAHERVDDLQRSLSERESEFEKLSRRVEQNEEELAAVRKDYERQSQTQEAAFAQRLEDEKLKWREQTLTYQNLRTDSPATSMRKHSGADFPHLGLPPSEVVRSRRPSVLPNQVFENHTPPRQNSLTSMSRTQSHLHAFETPSLQSLDRDELLSIPATPLSPPTNGVNDLISVSTVGAGPSVQLVERMSANVRRLETERAASKDELARLTAQRDEAREEVVSLMREVEQKLAADERIRALEQETQQMNDRYQTTLEMLGEKSELVEELKADVADLKKIYRELVDSTMK